MKNAKPIAVLALTGLGSALVASFQVPDTPALTTTTADPGGTASAAGPSADTGAGTGAGSGQDGAAAIPSPSVAGGTAASPYADGTYAGTAVDEPWGPFQVQATISGGRLVGVTLVQSPGDSHSSRINSQAVPWLTEAAIAAQSAQVDMVSGATWTSRSYATSLQGALDAAAAQG